MAYAPLKLHPVFTCPDPDVKQWWQYNSTEAVTAVDNDGFISDARARGMRVGDLVFVSDTDASPPATSICIVVTINANGSADLSTGTTITATAGD